MERHGLRKKGSKWFTSPRFAELETAKAWGLTPAAWDALPDDDKAQMLAFEGVLADMRGYEDHLAEQKRVADEAKREVKSRTRGKR